MTQRLVRFTLVLFTLLALVLGSQVRATANAASLKMATNDGWWTWVDGSNTFNQSGVYGTEDVADPANVPGARYSSISWVDASGNLWLFGGFGHDSNGYDGEMNDLWKYDPATDEWTWVDGRDTALQFGTYGTEDVADAANVPGARSSSISWIDASGNLWLFGGVGRATAFDVGRLNDLWKFNPSTGQWTWVDGSTTISQNGTYGTEDVADAANVPGARNGAASWTDASGNLWLFGGLGKDSAGDFDWLNDLWKFNPSTGQWTWVDGSNTINQGATYGTEDMAAADNVPGARRSAAASWIDSAGNLWLFGGYGYITGIGFGNLNDLWMFDPSSGEWTWVDGSNWIDQTSVYGTEDVADAANVPGARDSSVSWIDASGNLWLFGGYGFDSVGDYGYLNDLWMFDPSTGEWTWVDGSNIADQSGTYGTEDVKAAANVPGGRSNSVAWMDANGDLWFFGGGVYDGMNTVNSLNDLWKFSEPPADAIPPVINVPGTITVPQTTPTGAVVNFTVTATDETSPANPAVTCDWNSGDTFPLGTTTVNCSAMDDAGNPGYGSFDVNVVAWTITTFTSLGTYDGNVFETTEFSGLGGTPNISGGFLDIGDMVMDRQILSLLHFDTSSLPDGAQILGLTLQLKRYQFVGTDPFTLLGNLNVDIASPYFGAEMALRAGDFQASPSQDNVGIFNPTPLTGNWYESNLGASAFPFLNLTGATQFRLHFTLDDNDDLQNDFIRFFSGNAPIAGYRPVLVVYYYVP